MKKIITMLACTLLLSCGSETNKPPHNDDYGANIIKKIDTAAIIQNDSGIIDLHNTLKQFDSLSRYADTQLQKFNKIRNVKGNGFDPEIVQVEQLPDRLKFTLGSKWKVVASGPSVDREWDSVMQAKKFREAGLVAIDYRGTDIWIDTTWSESTMEKFLDSINEAANEERHRRKANRKFPLLSRPQLDTMQKTNEY